MPRGESSQSGAGMGSEYNHASHHRIRLYSAATLKPLGTLAYHRESAQALAFGTTEKEEQSVLEVGGDSDSDEDEDDSPRSNWLASGGKDRRIALWNLKITDT